MSQILIRSTRIRTRLIFRFVEVMVLELILPQIKKGNFKEFNYQDWINNDAAFALTDAIVPQAQYATKGMKEKIAELEEKAAPDAKWM